MSISYLDYETVCLINKEFCGPGAGVRDPRGVAAIVARPQGTWEGLEHFPRVVEKAAAYLHGFATTQYFLDGNKRTSFLCATVFIEENGFVFDGPSIDEAEAFLLAVAANDQPLTQVARWLDRYTFNDVTWAKLQTWQEMEDSGHY